MTGALRAWRTPLLGVALLGAALTAAGYAFAAANTVPASKAGDGAGAITGYAVSSVVYNLNAGDPRNIDSAAFSLDSAPPAGSTIRIKLVSGEATWYSCTNVAAAVTCVTTAPQATVAAADELRVVVAP